MHLAAFWRQICSCPNCTLANNFRRCWGRAGCPQARTARRGTGTEGNVGRFVVNIFTRACRPIRQTRAHRIQTNL